MLSTKGGGFKSWLGNSTQKLSFYKHVEIVPVCIDLGFSRSVSVSSNDNNDMEISGPVFCSLAWSKYAVRHFSSSS